MSAVILRPTVHEHASSFMTGANITVTWRFSRRRPSPAGRGRSYGRVQSAIRLADALFRCRFSTNSHARFRSGVGRSAAFLASSLTTKTRLEVTFRSYSSADFTVGLARPGATAHDVNASDATKVDRTCLSALFETRAHNFFYAPSGVDARIKIFREEFAMRRSHHVTML
jgi:hypothetical protein